MALSSKARKRLEIAVTSKTVGAEIADSIDREVTVARVINIGTPDPVDSELFYVDGFKDGHGRLIFGPGVAQHGGLIAKARAVNVNNITFTTVGDSGDGVTVEEVGNVVTVHFEDGVSTGNDVVAAVESDSALVTLEESADMPDPWVAPGDEFSGSVGSSMPGTPLSQANNFDSAEFGDLAVPMNLHIVFGADWNGGLVTVSGVGQAGDNVSETIDPNDGDDQFGDVAFASITGITKELMGSNVPGSSVNSCAVNLGNAFGIGDLQLANDMAVVYWTSSPPTLTVEQPSEVNTDSNTIKPETEPTGAETYTVLVNVLE